MKVIGVSVVRNAADLLRVNVLHHLSAGVGEFLILDNGSTDGTQRVLRRLAGRCALSWTVDEGRYEQSRMLTGLAREAALMGAEWVLPFDADELWTARGGFGTVLSATSAGALAVEPVNFVQSRARRRSSPRGLLTMTARTPAPIDVHEETPALLDRRRVAFVELRFPAKHVVRASREVEIAAGNHAVSGIDGPVEWTNEIACLHAMLRSRQALASRAGHGSRVDEAGVPQGTSWHVRRWRRVIGEGGLDAEWAANSYRDGGLSVNGTRRPMLTDTRLRDAARPWVRSPAKQALARLSGRPY